MNFQRFFMPRLGEYIKFSKNILLLGPRQTGKSTLIETLIQENKRPNLVFKLQEIKTFQQIVKSPEYITNVAESKLESGPINLFIDEVQKVPILLDGCQYLIDKYKKKLCVVLTGSSARKLKAKGVNLLPGRIILEYLHPLTLPEIYKTKIQRIVPLKTSIKYDFSKDLKLEDFLIYGTLPGILKEKRFRTKLLTTYVQTYLQEEVKAEALTRNLGLFSRFLELSSFESGGLPNLSKLSQETGIGLSTIKNYFQILEDTLIMHTIPAFKKDSRKQILSTPKYIYFDLGVRNVASNMPLNKGILNTEIGGKLFEQFICLELINRIKYEHPNWRYFYWRTNTGLEVDFIIQTEEEIIPVEIKFTNTLRRDHIKHLKVFMEEYKIKKGFVVGLFEDTQKLENNIYAIPWQEI